MSRERYCNYIHGMCSYSDNECRTVITAVSCREKREKNLKEVEREKDLGTTISSVVYGDG